MVHYLLKEGRCHIIAIHIPQQRLDLFQADVAHMLQQDGMQVTLKPQLYAEEQGSRQER